MFIFFSKSKRNNIQITTSGMAYSSGINFVDFTIKGLLIPVLHRMLIWLATKEFNTQPILVGDIKTIDIRGQDINDDWTVISPSNNEIKLCNNFIIFKL